jgi:hypothetical protein
MPKTTEPKTKRGRGRPPGRAPVVRLSLRLPPEIAAGLEELSARLGQSVNRIVTRAVAALLKREGAKR